MRAVKGLPLANFLSSFRKPPPHAPASAVARLSWVVVTAAVSDEHCTSFVNHQAHCAFPRDAAHRVFTELARQRSFEVGFSDGVCLAGTPEAR